MNSKNFSRLSLLSHRMRWIFICLILWFVTCYQSNMVFRWKWWGICFLMWWKSLSQDEEHSFVSLHQSIIIPRIYRGGLCFRDSNDGPCSSTMTVVITTNDGAIFFNKIDIVQLTKALRFHVYQELQFPSIFLGLRHSLYIVWVC